MCAPRSRARHWDRNNALCITHLVEYLIVDDQIVRLCPVDGRWGALYVRVSDETQRSSKTGRKVADGFSEEEQLNRGVRYFIAQGWAFKVYSDCGISGDYPVDDPALVKRLLQKRADRYRKIYVRTLMDETSLRRRTPRKIASMNAYLEKQCARILQGNLTEEEIYQSEDLNERTKRSLRGSSRRRAYHRQAYTQLWRDVEEGRVHVVAATDRSRLNRDADLETEFDPPPFLWTVLWTGG